MAAAFATDLLDEGLTIPADRGLEIGIGFVMAFIASLLVMKPFLAIREALRVRPLRVVSDRASAPCFRRRLRRGMAPNAMMQWLRRSFIAGFFVTVPLFISVAAFIWIFNVVDGLTTPFYDRLIGSVPACASRAWAS